MRTLFLISMLVLAQACNAQSWANDDAKPTIEEFLQLYFNSTMHRHETFSALNSFNLVTFLPASNRSAAIVFVVQTYNVGDANTSDPALRREIRITADAMLASFAAQLRLPIVKKRWSPSQPQQHLVIKHVRENDIQDVLAVTAFGETSFEPDKFKEAATKVNSAGGMWSW